VAGAVGTAAMDLLLYRRYRREGGKEPPGRWELAAGVTSWDEASAPRATRPEGGAPRHAAATPRQLGPDHDERRALGNRHRLGASSTPHWPAGRPGARGCVPSHRARRCGWRATRSFRWAGVYRPIWEYHAQGLAKDLSAHLVFGTTTSAVFATLTRERP
jgi:hypothetical protein